MDTNLAKAQIFIFFIPPAKAGGNSFINQLFKNIKLTKTIQNLNQTK